MAISSPVAEAGGGMIVESASAWLMKPRAAIVKIDRILVKVFVIFNSDYLS